MGCYNYASGQVFVANERNATLYIGLQGFSGTEGSALLGWAKSCDSRDDFKYIRRKAHCAVSEAILIEC